MSKEAKVYHHKWISDEKDLRDRYEVMQDFANRYHKEQLCIHGVVGSAETQTNDDDEGWIYCPNCGRVKEDS